MARVARSLYAVPQVAHPPPAIPPALRPVRRARLVRRLSDPGAALAVLVAPAGYGKTTLLRQWAAGERRPHAWLGLSEAHNDPAVLEATIDEELEGLEHPSALILDRLDAVTARPALAVLEDLIGTVAAGSIVAVASRAEPRLGLGRLRATIGVVELRRDDLRMDAVEAELLVRRAGVHLSSDDQARLLRRTEGWPAGLRLASGVLREAGDPHAALARFGGEDRVVADYLSEQLADLTDDERALLMATAPLDLLTGELCDAVLGRRGTGSILRDLARSNVLLDAVDRSEEHFRAHPLLAEALRAELHRVDPGQAYEVHRRASSWYERRGEARRAIDHAIAGGQYDAAGVLLWRSLPGWWGAGSRKAIERWLTRVGEHEVAAHPALSLVAAAVAVVARRRTAAERWVSTAERTLAAAEESRPRLEAEVAVMRAAMGGAGAADMAARAERAQSGGDPDDPWRGPALLLEGIGRHLVGDAAEARDRLEAGVVAAAGSAPAFEALGLSQLALISLARDAFEEGAELALRARGCVERLDPGDHIPGDLVHAVAAFALSHRGEAARARSEADRARHALAVRGESPAWYDAQARIALARAELRLSDAAAARALIAEASRAARRIPDAVQLQRWINDAWARADAFAAEAVSGHWTLTTAELRVLRFLPSHLSFREIAARLHVSSNTVKTQAHAVYRKLDVSSRSEAVTKALAIGLVDH